LVKVSGKRIINLLHLGKSISNKFYCVSSISKWETGSKSSGSDSFSLISYLNAANISAVHF
jgi:hypothetical protein